MITTNFATFTYTIAAGATVKIARQFKHIRGLSGTAPYQVRFPNAAPSAFETGLAYNAPQTIESVELINNGALSNTITVALADGPIDDNRLVGQIDISGGIRNAGNRGASYGAVSVAATATLIRAENLNRGTILVQNNGAVDLYVANDTSVTAANGIKVPAGGSASVTLQTDIYGIAASGTLDVRYLEESL